MNGSKVETPMTVEDAKALISLHGTCMRDIMDAAQKLGFAMGGKEAWAQAAAEVEEELKLPKGSVRTAMRVVGKLSRGVEQPNRKHGGNGRKRVLIEEEGDSISARYRAYIEANDYIPSDCALASITGKTRALFSGIRSEMSNNGYVFKQDKDTRGWIVVARPEPEPEPEPELPLENTANTPPNIDVVVMAVMKVLKEMGL